MSKFGKYSFPFVDNSFFRRLKAPKVFRLLFNIFKEYLFSVKTYITAYKELIYKSRVTLQLYLSRFYKALLRVTILKYPIHSVTTKFTALRDKIFSPKLLTSIVRDQVSSVTFSTRLFAMAEYTDFIFFSSESDLAYDNGSLDFENLMDYEDTSNRFSYNNESARFIAQNNDLGYKILAVPSGFLQPVKVEIAQKQYNTQDLFNVYTDITLDDVTYTFYITKTVMFVESGIRFIFGEFDDTPIKPVITKINYK